MKEIIFSKKAYSKIILHAAKYPHCSINGVLLAADNKNKPNENSNSIKYLDAIPLFHVCLHVTPMAEIALCQIDLWAQSIGLIIAGYYLANDNLNELSFEKLTLKIANKISEKYRSSALIVIDNKLVTLEHATPAIDAFVNIENKWKPLDKCKIKVDDTTLKVTSDLLQKKTYSDLIDFDNHLDNISQDWKNEGLNKIVKNTYRNMVS